MLVGSAKLQEGLWEGVVRVTGEMAVEDLPYVLRLSSVGKGEMPTC